MKILLNVWNRLSLNGLEKGAAESYFQEIVFLNRYILTIGLVILAYVPFNILILGFSFLFTISLYLATLVFVMLLVRFKLYVLARAHFILLTNLFVFMLVLESGGLLDGQLFFIPISLLGIILFKRSVWFIYGSILLSILLYYSSIWIAEVQGPMISFDESKIQMIKGISNLAAFLFSIALLFSVRHVTRERNKILKQQTEVISIKSRELNESIRYAKRLQNALRPDLKELNKYISGFSLLYKPKDEVSGDFAMLKEIDETSVWVTTADGTGHGVPGALVSFVCASVLNRTLDKMQDASCSQVLDRIAREIEGVFNKSSSEEVKDGMDAGLLKLRKCEHEYELEWAGAQQPLIILSNNLLNLQFPFIQKMTDNEKLNVFQIKPDRQPVGKYDYRLPFTNHKFQLNYGDRLIMASDGFSDQFGGVRNKKLRASKFRELLIDTYNLEIDVLASNLDEYFERWKGEVEQIDDVIVLSLQL